jgi:outer membrane protein OmpA-like peptidoglycan-associated protein/uncharacterized protein YidB (DUF937 family)
MALLDTVISEVAGKFGLGSSATALVREVLSLVVGSPGGFGGFLNRVKSAGLGTELISWLGNTEAAPLLHTQVEKLFGSTVLSGIAQKLGLGDSVVSTATAFVLPKLIGLLTPGGSVPATLPAEVIRFLSPAPSGVPRHADRPAERKGLGWLWAALGVLALAAVGWLLTNFFAGDEKPVQTAQAPAPVTTPAPVAPPTPAPVAKPAPAPVAPPAPAPVAKPAPAPAPVPAPSLPATFSISNEKGIVRYSGVVHDEATRQSILNELKATYGADKIKGDITVDAQRADAPWLAKLHDALGKLKIKGVEALFSDHSVNIGGLVDGVERTRLYKFLAGLFGGDWKVGALSDHFGEVVSSANKNAATSLAALKPGFSAADLVGVLNLSILNFPTASAEIGSQELALLQNAAAKIKTLPAATVIEIDGYTDNTGSDERNVSLSQRRADAVRKSLVDAGVAPAALVAKGFGSANPIASNDSVEGRFRNRRIEYRVGR